ncbi:hypothetical protein EDD22DRAFT_1003860 [Suillus occidentalis]|nr:hypothetical protein EDD22DRAFT_1003860 [Suillus occidentalis]
MSRVARYLKTFVVTNFYHTHPEAKSTVGKDNIHLKAPRGPKDQAVKIPSRLPFQIGELEGKRFLVLMRHSPRSVKVALERRDYDGFALPAAIYGSQSSRLPEGLADDADDEDAIPSIIDPLAAGVIVREMRADLARRLRVSRSRWDSRTRTRAVWVSANGENRTLPGATRQGTQSHAPGAHPMGYVSPVYRRLA